jgi:hypothetical protein
MGTRSAPRALRCAPLSRRPALARSPRPAAVHTVERDARPPERCRSRCSPTSGCAGGEGAKGAAGAAIEWAPRNIRVNAVAPGLTATPTIEASIQRSPDPEAYRRERETQIPLQRLAAPEEVADAVNMSRLVIAGPAHPTEPHR